MKFSLKEIPCDTPKKCEFSVGPASTTCMYYPPCYNRAGENLNPDGNTTSYIVNCFSCGKSWGMSECLGKKTITEVKS